eukprot:Rhum_TRINITY_DN15502_c1_g4::Rhum_TRINITY_DN15502_c1_g4_i4::g.161020::m.161020
MAPHFYTTTKKKLRSLLRGHLPLLPAVSVLVEDVASRALHHPPISGQRLVLHRRLGSVLLRKRVEERLLVPLVLHKCRHHRRQLLRVVALVEVQQTLPVHGVHVAARTHRRRHRGTARRRVLLHLLRLLRLLLRRGAREARRHAPPRRVTSLLRLPRLALPRLRERPDHRRQLVLHAGRVELLVLLLLLLSGGTPLLHAACRRHGHACSVRVHGVLRLTHGAAHLRLVVRVVCLLLGAVGLFDGGDDDVAGGTQRVARQRLVHGARTLLADARHLLRLVEGQQRVAARRRQRVARTRHRRQVRDRPARGRDVRHAALRQQRVRVGAERVARRRGRVVEAGLLKLRVEVLRGRLVQRHRVRVVGGGHHLRVRGLVLVREQPVGSLDERVGRLLHRLLHLHLVEEAVDLVQQTLRLALRRTLRKRRVQLALVVLLARRVLVLQLPARVAQLQLALRTQVERRAALDVVAHVAHVQQQLLPVVPALLVLVLVEPAVLAQ